MASDGYRSVAFLEMVCPLCRTIWGLPLDAWKGTTRELWSCPQGHVHTYSRSGYGGSSSSSSSSGLPPNASAHVRELERDIARLRGELIIERERIRELGGEKGTDIYRCPVGSCDFQRKRKHLLRAHLAEVHGWAEKAPLLLRADAGPDAHGQGT